MYMITKTINAKTLRDNLRQIIIDVNNLSTEYIIEYTKGMKVKISPIESTNNTKFERFLESNQWKNDDNYKVLSNKELRKLAYDHRK
jgi:hypothetical protein